MRRYSNGLATKGLDGLITGDDYISSDIDMGLSVVVGTSLLDKRKTVRELIVGGGSGG